MIFLVLFINAHFQEVCYFWTLTVNDSSVIWNLISSALSFEEMAHILSSSLWMLTLSAKFSSDLCKCHIAVHFFPQPKQVEWLQMYIWMKNICVFLSLLLHTQKDWTLLFIERREVLIALWFISFFLVWNGISSHTCTHTNLGIQENTEHRWCHH